MRNNKKQKYLILLTVGVLLIITVFSILNWEVIIHLFHEMISGVAIVKEYVLSLGIVGVIAITAVQAQMQG